MNTFNVDNRFWVRVLIITSLFSSSLLGSNTMQYLQGYSKAKIGGGFKYHSPHPDINSSLLVRGTKDEGVIEWESQIISEEYNQETIKLIWFFGIANSAKDHNFKLFINDEYTLSFTNKLGNRIGQISFEGSNGTILSFNAIMVDKYSDLMGTAILEIPKEILKIGKSVKLRVEGDNSGQQAWYMTFQGKVEEDISLSQTNIITRGKENNYIKINLQIVHLGKEDKLNVIWNNSELMESIKTGYNSYSLAIPTDFVEKNISFNIKIGNSDVITKTLLIQPIKYWTINLVMHSHTDIGYTRPQTEILPEHLRYIDYVLDFCDQTDGYPDEAKFRWTCESTWPVKEYLKSRPQFQIDRFKKRVQEGRIELTGMMFNISEMADESLLAGMMQPINEIRSKGLKIEAAMQNDINGIGWCFVDYFAETDIKYLIMGEHNHRALIPFNYPTPFWWQSPSGNKILSYRADHYMTGNMLGFHTGNISTIEPSLSEYLLSLDEKKYPYNEAHIQLSGYFTDNSPPSTIVCDLVKDWNTRYVWPKLKISTSTEFLKNIESNYADKIETIKAAWPDWWADGFGSAARETAASRITQADLVTNSGLMFIAKTLGAKLPENIIDEIQSIEESLLFYAEHTFGYAESVRDPSAEQTHLQWLEKASNIWESVKDSRMLKETAMGFIQEHLPKYETPSIAVFNTLNWERSALTKIYIDHEMLPPNSAFALIDNEGNEIYAQKLNSRADGSYWGVWAENIPAMGYKTYRIIVNDGDVHQNPVNNNAKLLENEYYKISLDEKNGAISSIIDKETNFELVDQNSKWKFGQFIYEQLSNRSQLERYSLEEEPILSSLSEIEVSDIIVGKVYTSIKVKGKNNFCAENTGINIEVRLFNNSKKIDFIYNLRKKPTIEPEAIYVAFPFFEDNTKIIFEAQGGMVRPGIDQIKGTSSDWNVIQNYASIENANHQITFASNEIPLAHFGGLNVGRFDYQAKPEKPHIFSWVMNNYWVTNFRAYQEGEFTWSYSITSDRKQSRSQQYKFGYGERIPLAARVFPARKANSKSSSKSLINLNIPNLILISTKPIENMNTFVLQIKEVNGIQTKLKLSDLLKANLNSIKESNVLGKIKSDKKEVTIKPYETKFIKVSFNSNN